MTTFELTAEVGADHRLVVDVPSVCPPGRHRVLLLVDSDVEPSEPQGDASSGDTPDKTGTQSPGGPFAWEDGVLVYTGEWIGPPVEDLVEWERDLRMSEILREGSDADSR